MTVSRDELKIENKQQRRDVHSRYSFLGGLFLCDRRSAMLVKPSFPSSLPFLSRAYYTVIHRHLASIVVSSLQLLFLLFPLSLAVFYIEACHVFPSFSRFSPALYRDSKAKGILESAVSTKKSRLPFLSLRTLDRSLCEARSYVRRLQRKCRGGYPAKNGS
jgi:hypothetical protein